MQQEIDNVVKWIQQYVKCAKAQGVVIGLSGGIDSAVVAALAVKALGANNVYGMYLPTQLLRETKININNFATKYAFAVATYDIDDVVGYSRGRTIALNNTLIAGNFAARFRMAILYANASHRNFLVIGTSNKTELQLGYFTKYGDGGVDFEPLGNFYKTEIYALAKELGIPKCFINKQPSADLWAGQTDEDEIGFKYADIDVYLQTGKTIIPDLAVSIDKRIAQNQHKHRLPAIFERNRYAKNK